MKIKKFTAENTQLGLREVRKTLGEDAIVLNVTEKLDRKTGKRFVELTAALDDEMTNERHFWQEHKPRFSLVSDDEVGKTGDSAVDGSFGFTYSPRRPSTASVPKTTARPQPQTRQSNNDGIKTNVENVLDWLQGGIPVDISLPFLESFMRLITSGVNRKLALEITKIVESKLSEQGKTSKKLVLNETIRSIEAFLTRFTEPERKHDVPKIHVMVGPTGVGKTTCIAKLSAMDQIYRQKQVGLLSIDTYRIAAIEQLRTYAQITRLPLEIVYRPEDMTEALQRLSDCDVIYIDTPGRSPRDRKTLVEMLKFFQGETAFHFHLVLSLNSSEEYLKETVNRFSIFPIKKLLFTKIDETDTIGALLGVLQHSKKPISFISNGQEVPDDIHEPQPVELAEKLVGVRH